MGQYLILERHTQWNWFFRVCISIVYEYLQDHGCSEGMDSNVLAKIKYDIFIYVYIIMCVYKKIKSLFLIYHVLYRAYMYIYMYIGVCLCLCP